MYTYICKQIYYIHVYDLHTSTKEKVPYKYIYVACLCFSTVVKDSTVVLGTTTLLAALLLCG